MTAKTEQLRLAVQLISLGEQISRGLGSPEQLARLALIAAAPQLLEALQVCANEYKERAWTDPASPTSPVHAARAAIKAAEEA